VILYEIIEKIVYLSMDTYYIFFVFMSLTFFGTILFYFGNTKKRVFHRDFFQFLGGIITLGSIALSFLFLNWFQWIFLIVLVFSIISFSSAVLVEFVTKKRIK